MDCPDCRRGVPRAVRCGVFSVTSVASEKASELLVETVVVRTSTMSEASETTLASVSDISHHSSTWRGDSTMHRGLACMIESHGMMPGWTRCMCGVLGRRSTTYSSRNSIETYKKRNESGTLFAGAPETTGRGDAFFVVAATAGGADCGVIVDTSAAGGGLYETDGARRAFDT